MGTTDSSSGGDEGAAVIGRPVPEFVDWIAAAVIALAGMALIVGGSALAFVVDRALLEDGVESGRISVVVLERDLTRTEMLEFTLEVVSWTGIGLLVTGVGLVLFAIGYVVSRRRTHRRLAAGDTPGSYRAYAVLGAVATAVLSFVPFSPVLGGGLAGYLERFETGRSISAGALSGLLSVIPILAILVFLTAGLLAGFAGIQETGLGIVTTAVMLLVVLFVGAFGAGLGALGGFVGGYFAENPSRRET